MSDLDEIVKAFRAIEEAERNYRAIVREKITAGLVQQAEVARALNRTRESVRQDAMTDAERQAMREADAKRKRASRAKAAKATARKPKAMRTPK